MRKSIYILSLLILVSCKTEREINKSAPYQDTVILLGPADDKGFQQEPYNIWYTPNYDEYKVDSNTISELRSLIKEIEIVTFMGTWCGDSKRETPAFLKILDAVDFKRKKHNIYAVSREKTTPQKVEKDLNITNVPTFIFYKDGKEINRIVEYPIESLEKDMLKILKGIDYKHAYFE
ncbi:MAG: thioredoxin family protein [Flavobacteriaceae bacterium]|nr:thioredoxin family protein [Bacteroidia bacterium]NNL16237.1 thioredoxin family protein [Flavobacteriaceae bacterium]